ncbi:MAG: hypothetical protein MUF78_07620 [Candidatus Edwardsbacteria bacterium]|jgi:hypothetical protein|nr:hypothetical protein [Candidatus Edwardsbacteria bacterium]
MNGARIASLSAALVLLSAASCRDPRQRFAASGSDDGQWSCAVAPYDSIEAFALSPDGQRISFLGRKDGRWQFVVSAGWKWKVSDRARIDGDPGRDTGRTLTLSPDGGRVAIVYSRTSTWRNNGPRPLNDGNDTNGQWFVMIDRHVFGGFDRDFKPTVRFSKDGTLFGFPYKKMGQCCVQIADTTFGPYERADVAFTKDGEVFLGYLKHGRAYIEMVKRQDDPVRINASR